VKGKMRRLISGTETSFRSTGKACRQQRPARSTDALRQWSILRLLAIVAALPWVMADDGAHRCTTDMKVDVVFLVDASYSVYSRGYLVDTMGFIRR
jgi:hypothetical protein